MAAGGRGRWVRARDQLSARQPTPLRLSRKPLKPRSRHRQRPLDSQQQWTACSRLPGWRGGMARSHDAASEPPAGGEDGGAGSSLQVWVCMG